MEIFSKYFLRMKISCLILILFYNKNSIFFSYCNLIVLIILIRCAHRDSKNNINYTLKQIALRVFIKISLKISGILCEDVNVLFNVDIFFNNNNSFIFIYCSLTILIIRIRSVMISIILSIRLWRLHCDFFRNSSSKCI